VSVWIPFLEIGWTIFTFALAGAKSYNQLLALRFIVGLFEAGYWPALYYILGSWYNKREPYSTVWISSIANVSPQVNLESAMVSYNLRYRLRQFSVDFYNQAFTPHSMVALVLLDGDGYSVSIL
jgi:MFS family permease